MFGVFQAPNYVDVAGARIAVESRGSGRPLVLVHGFGADRHTWDGLWDRLAADRRVVGVDLRGCGESIESSPTTFNHARDLELVLDALEIDQTDLMGVSLGGAVSISLALDAPERVRRLVLIGPGLTGWEWTAAWRELWFAIISAARAGRLDEARDLWWNHPLFAPTRRIESAAAELRRSIDAYSCRQWIDKDRHERVQPDLGRLHELAAPALILTGTDDYEDFRTIADIFAATVPNGIRIDFEGGGHLLHLEQPDAVVEEVARFLGAGTAAFRQRE